MILDALKLSWEIQVALASGYAAYALAYTGLRDRQRPIDVVFISIVFSLIASLFLSLQAFVGAIAASVVAFGMSLACGVLWRRFGRPALFALMHKWNVTWADDEPSALATIIANTRHRMTQIAVLLDDGTWLSCKNAEQFNNAPFGPCLIGPNGDLALYLTHEQPRDAEERELKTVRDGAWGDRITYIPAARIQQMTVRYRANRSAQAVAVAQPESAAQTESSVAR
jgi:hypothetical protein